MFDSSAWEDGPNETLFPLKEPDHMTIADLDIERKVAFSSYQRLLADAKLLNTDSFSFFGMRFFHLPCKNCPPLSYVYCRVYDVDNSNLRSYDLNWSDVLAHFKCDPVAFCNDYDGFLCHSCDEDLRQDFCIQLDSHHDDYLLSKQKGKSFIVKDELCNFLDCEIFSLKSVVDYLVLEFNVYAKSGILLLDGKELWNFKKVMVSWMK